ncbi:MULTISPECIES: hypothetical protein [unclassified Synechocystis]|nr:MULTISPECIES: hypothetical protein [unclassified Synechocystis]
MADYSMACALLSPELQRQYSPQTLQQTVEVRRSLISEKFSFVHH